MLTFVIAPHLYLDSGNVYPGRSTISYYCLKTLLFEFLARFIYRTYKNNLER